MQTLYPYSSLAYRETLFDSLSGQKINEIETQCPVLVAFLRSVLPNVV